MVQCAKWFSEYSPLLPFVFIRIGKRCHTTSPDSTVQAVGQC